MGHTDWQEARGGRHVRRSEPRTGVTLPAMGWRAGLTTNECLSQPGVALSGGQGLSREAEERRFSKEGGLFHRDGGDV